MKKLLIAVLFIALIPGIQAQSEKSETTGKAIKHTLTANMINAKQNASYYPWIYPCYDCFWYPVMSSQSNLLPGVLYTISYKGMFARIGFNGIGVNEKSKDDNYSTLSKKQTLLPYIGAGGNVKMNKLSFLYGVDVVLILEETLSEYEYKNPEYDYIQKSSEMAFGASPFIGLSLKLTDRLSFRTESAFRVTSFKQTNSTKYPNNTYEPTKSTKTGSRFRANALNQVGLDIRL